MAKFKKIKSWIPLPSLLPLRTFPSRVPLKWKYIFTTLQKLVFLKLGRIGARVIGTNQVGNTLLRLNRDYPVGKKGFVIELPRDEVIFNQLKYTGSWEREISEFLASGLKKISLRNDPKAAMIDIGANCGFISLQTMNISQTPDDYFLIEPLPRHVHALRNNLEKMSKSKKINIFEFALSDKNGCSEIYTERLNQGNSTILPNVVQSYDNSVTNIRLLDTKSFCDDYLSEFSDYVIKSDTQGMDALILSRIPIKIWKNVESAVIEVWALPEVLESDVHNLLAMWKEFDCISWSSNSTETGGGLLHLEDVRKFWLSKSRVERNLFLSKSN
jgi:FkbM family methyltransferase